MKKSKIGFSIAELIVVLGIIALISLISIPLLVNYQKITKLRSESRLLATNLRLAQQMAITEQTTYNLKLFSLIDSYQVINSETSVIIKDVDLDSEISISSIVNFTDDTIQFNATGGVLENGSIILINTKNDTITLEIKPSGYVEIIE